MLTFAKLNITPVILATAIWNTRCDPGCGKFVTVGHVMFYVRDFFLPNAAILLSEYTIQDVVVVIQQVLETNPLVAFLQRRFRCSKTK